MKDITIEKVIEICKEVNGDCKKCEFVITIDVNATILPSYALQRMYCCPFSVKPMDWNKTLIAEKRLKELRGEV